MACGNPDLYMKKIEEFLNTPDDTDIGYFIEVDLRYPDNLREKTKNFPFCPENKFIHKYKNIDYMKAINPKKYTKFKKLLCVWTDRKNYLFH